MDPSSSGGRESVLSTLRRFSRSAQPRGAEQCDFCSTILATSHRHLLEVATRKIICACDACALRFENVVGRWKLIPRDARVLSDFQMTDAEWETLALPINLAFFFYSNRCTRLQASKVCLRAQCHTNIPDAVADPRWSECSSQRICHWSSKKRTGSLRQR